jgi:alkanesulfonate monooxygenase SsuD/methylene tetrahydromethanopterin reductase-like flavin-dependent oxidoreductase (luciferase family)
MHASHFAPQQLGEALKIFRTNFKPSEYLKEPYAITCVNVTAEEAQLIATSMEKIFLGILTNNRSPLQPADANFKVSPEAKQVMQQFLTYSFIGNPSKIKEDLTQFVDDTQIDELMVVSHIYDHSAKLNSYKILRELQSAS